MKQDENRPDPDALLEAVQREESRQQRGKLKIFFGMSAGVGKTYAMLEAAQQRLAEGIDVVIGYVETHGRTETEALLKGLPIIPRKKVEYRGATFEELDVDAVLERKPQLVLVDELAHTNVEGSRHPKRYQDVLDLLASGIDVYTTVNVQHLESRADAVARITGIIVHETVPDTLIDIADEIELIDLEPEELLRRLAEGKVYTPERAELAAKNFFRKGNLTALREMALRLTAERVDQQMQDYMQVKHIQGPWKSLERLMVAVSPSPLSERLIRWTRRTAYTLKAPWLAIYVEPATPLNETQKAQLVRNLALVRKLGGEVVSTSSEDPAREIIRIAKQRNVTQIIVGKPAHNRLQEFLGGGAMVNRLIQLSGDIDVYVISGDKTESAEHPVLPRPAIHSGRNQYLIVCAVVIVAIGISYALAPLVGYVETALFMLFVIVLLGNFVGRGPILLAATLSAVLIDLLFIPPQFSFSISSLQHGMILGLYFFIALVTGNLTARLATQKRLMQQREDRTAALYRMSRHIAAATNLDALLKIAVEYICTVFDADAAILLPDATGKLSTAPHPASTLKIDEKERSVAEWAFDHNQPAGRFTDTLPNSTAQYLPLATPGGVVGVLGIGLKQALSVDQEALLETFVSHIALAVERELLDEAARRAEVLAESERLYATLLDSVSHELRSPLIKIDQAASALLDPDNLCNAQIQLSSGQSIKAASSQLNQLVSNLLNMTRLESGHLRLDLQPCNIQKLINDSLARVRQELTNHDLVIDVAPNLPEVPLDCALMEQVMVNLLQNAAHHTPPGVRVRVTAKTEESELVISVADRGPGLPPEDTSRVFEKFYRAPQTQYRGTGLGLSICKGIVEAHGGTISAENRPTRGGARFTIRLPLTDKVQRTQAASSANSAPPSERSAATSNS
jgi:two-component system sensor histidine kinase KdpD